MLSERLLSCAALAGALLCACGAGSDPPRRIDLAAGFEPSPRAGDVSWDEDFLLRFRPDGGVDVHATIGADEWGATVWPGVWQVVRPLAAYYRSAELWVGERRLERLTIPDIDMGAVAEVPEGSFLALDGNVFVRRAPDTGPPQAARLVMPIERGASIGGRWRVWFDRFAADGIPVWPGHREELVVDVPPASRLTFATVLWRIGEPSTGGEVTFRVRLDGEVVLEERRGQRGLRGNVRFRAVDLPAEGRPGARLAFEVEGPPAIAAFATPLVQPIVPREADPRPDLVLFVADTFRADNMTTYGGELDLTPTLDALADESVVFERAWSPSTWTLPAHASLFTGLHPHEHTATAELDALPRDAETLAEVLARAGYRTGAVTDGGYVSRYFGIDQGFAYFDEGKRDFEQTIAAARRFLAAGDGRPTFLFVHTYRVHEPYVATPAARAALEGRVEFGRDFPALKAALGSEVMGWDSREAIPADERAVVDEMLALYRGGVVDFDRGFGDLLGVLADAGTLERGYLVFTSDHGEAFGEHGALKHGTGVWEEHVRIPLLVHGPDLAPRRVPFAATLVDVPQTLAALADAPVGAGWGGRDLLALDADRPAYVFQCSIEPHARSGLAVVDAERKAILPDPAFAEQNAEAGADTTGVWAAYELGSDPDERRDESDAPWASRLAVQHAPRLAELGTARLVPDGAELDAAAEAELDALGYVDGD